MTLDELPEILTIAEAAAVLRVSRTTYYSEARRFEATGGEEGLPVIRVGHSLRVPKHALSQVLANAAAPAIKPVTWEEKPLFDDWPGR